MVPMDLMSLQPEVNLDHVKEAGLDPAKFPEDGKTLLEWAEAMTKREGDKVTRSGIMMTGSGVQPTVTWGIVAAQLGFERASADLKTAAVNPKAGVEAMGWVLDLFDKHKVSTRDVTDRYKAFGTGQGSIFWTGPWTLNGYVQQKLNFATYLFPTIGKEQLTYFEQGGLELYTQKDKGRHAATMDAVKWLSDNSFLWTTVGRGASPQEVDPGAAGLQDRRPALGGARRLHRGHVVRDSWARSRSWPAPTSRSIRAATSSPRRWRASGRGRASPRMRWRRSQPNGRRASTPAEPMASVAGPAAIREAPTASRRRAPGSTGPATCSSPSSPCHSCCSTSRRSSSASISRSPSGASSAIRSGSGSPTSRRRWPTSGWPTPSSTRCATR